MNEDESDLDRRFARLLSGEQDIDDTEAPNDDDSSSGSSYQYFEDEISEEIAVPIVVGDKKDFVIQKNNKNGLKLTHESYSYVKDGNKGNNGNKLKAKHSKDKPRSIIKDAQVGLDAQVGHKLILIY